MVELRRILWLALIAGLVAGVVVTAAQLLTTTPLILAAEAYEKASIGAGHAASHARTANTLLFNVLAGIGFGLILSALLSMQARPDLRQGFLLGAFAFLAVTLAPALGLPPELPGAVSGALPERASAASRTSNPARRKPTAIISRIGRSSATTRICLADMFDDTTSQVTFLWRRHYNDSVLQFVYRTPSIERRLIQRAGSATRSRT